MPAGRPLVYDAEHHPRLAREKTAEGKTLADLAQLFDVARSTIQKWQVEHTEFAVAIREGREDATDKVERALFERATGYSHPDEKILVVEGAVERVDTVAHYPPDTKAAQLWLNNLRPDRWKDKQHVEHTINGDLADRLAKAQNATIAAPDVAKDASNETNGNVPNALRHPDPAVKPHG
jgi:hypothetical protein